MKEQEENLVDDMKMLNDITNYDVLQKDTLKYPVVVVQDFAGSRDKGLVTQKRFPNALKVF